MKYKNKYQGSFNYEKIFINNIIYYDLCIMPYGMFIFK